MRLTKYPQSCLLLEKDGARIVVDPGNIALDRHQVDEFGDVAAVLFTHQHADHLDQRHLDDWRQRGAAMYGNADVCAVIGEGATEVRDGEPFTIAGFEVTPRDLPHVEMVDGSPGPPNTGFVVDATLFHPGDGIELAGISVDHLAVPIAGPSISFRDAYRLVESTGAATAVPIHYDFFVADPDLFARFCTIAEVAVLRPGESIEL